MQWNLEVVPVSVDDVDRAKAFYANQLGFHVDLDIRISDELRIVQFAPPGSHSSIQLKAGASRLDGLQLVVDDIDAARAELAKRGVEVSPVTHFEDGVRLEGRGGDWNSLGFFTDLDGNT